MNGGSTGVSGGIPGSGGSSGVGPLRGLAEAFTIIENTDEECTAAMHAVERHAFHERDRRLLLDMLGLGH